MCDRIGDHAVDADAREQQSEHGEDAEELHGEPVVSDGCREHVVHRLDVVNRQVLIHTEHRSAHACRHPLRLASGAHHKRERAPRRVLRIGNIDLRVRLRVEPIRVDIADDADDLARELFVAPHGQPFTDRVFSGEDAAGERLVDEDDGRSLRRVTLREVASGFNRDTHRPEVVGRRS